MVRRPNVLTSAAFSALSAAAAIILLVIGAALFTLPASNFSPAGAARNIAAVPTLTTAVNEPQAGGANNAVLPPVADNFQATTEKSTSELLRKRRVCWGSLGRLKPHSRRLKLSCTLPRCHWERLMKATCKPMPA